MIHSSSVFRPKILSISFLAKLKPGNSEKLKNYSRSIPGIAKFHLKSLL